MSDKIEDVPFALPEGSNAEWAEITDEHRERAMKLLPCMTSLGASIMCVAMNAGSQDSDALRNKGFHVISSMLATMPISVIVSGVALAVAGLMEAGYKDAARWLTSNLSLLAAVNAVVLGEEGQLRKATTDLRVTCGGPENESELTRADTAGEPVGRA